MTEASPTCPRCKSRVAVRLHDSQVCPQCESTEAWTRYGSPGVTLVIDRRELAVASARRLEGMTPRARLAFYMCLALSLAAVSLATASLLLVADALAPRELGPLVELFAEIATPARLATGMGTLAMLAGAAALITLRRRHLIRSVALILAGSAGMVAGVSGAVVGGFTWHSASTGFGWDHNSIPALQPTPGIAHSIMEAAAVVLAPGPDGNSSDMAIGSGIVIRTAKNHAWIVTCSHVAMPYAAVAAYRDAEEAHPVLVYLSDGRSAPAHVRWTAQPPLDVALIDVEIDNPPPPVSISRSGDAVSRGEEVIFVPNPLRSGWASHRGTVTRRRSHLTPAGEYSLVFTDLPVQPGDSGSGLFDSSGRLIGLNTWARTEPDGPKGISLPSDTMDALLEFIETDSQKPRNTPPKDKR